MNPVRDYKSILSEVIKKQIFVVGPQIAIQKARSVAGLTVSEDGTVTSIQGDPQIVMQGLIEQFVQLSGMIVRKTMEPFLAISGDNSQKPLEVSPQAEIDKVLKGIAPL